MVVLCGYVEFGSEIELFAFFGLAVLLEGAELDGLFFAAAGKARFLKLQITELFLVDEKSVDLDETAADGDVVIVEMIGKLHVAAGEDGHLQRNGAPHTPPDIGDGLSQLAFARANRLELFFEGSDVGFVGGGVVAGEENGAAGERGFDGVQTRFGFAFRSFGSGGQLGVGAVGGELGGGDRGRCGRGDFDGPLPAVTARNRDLEAWRFCFDQGGIRRD